MNTYQELLPTKLLKITDRFYGRVHYTSQPDIDRAKKFGLLIRCRCRNGRLISHHNEEMGWHNKPDATLHPCYLEGAMIEEVDATTEKGDAK